MRPAVDTTQAQLYACPAPRRALALSLRAAVAVRLHASHHSAHKIMQGNCRQLLFKESRRLPRTRLNSTATLSVYAEQLDKLVWVQTETMVRHCLNSYQTFPCHAVNACRA